MCSEDCTGWNPTNEICIDSSVPNTYSCPPMVKGKEEGLLSALSQRDKRRHDACQAEVVKTHRAIGSVDAVREATRCHQGQYVQGDQVDEEHVATPRRHLPDGPPVKFTLHQVNKSETGSNIHSVSSQINA